MAFVVKTHPAFRPKVAKGAFERAERADDWNRKSKYKNRDDWE